MTLALTHRIAIGSLKPLALTLALAASQSAWAEANPYYIGVSQAFSHDSNLFRVQGSEVSSGETISSTGLVGGIDQPFGRQRLRVNGTLQSNRYSNNPSLNNTGYGLNAALDWSTIERLSGTLSYSANQNLANYATPNTPLITSRNLQKTQELSAQAVLGGVTRLSFTAGYNHREVDYSALAYDAQQFQQDAGSLGLRYRFSGALDAGAALRVTRGRYPHFQDLGGGAFRADTLNRRDLDLTSNWTPTGATAVSARVSFGRETHSISDQRDFSGVTGSLAITHNPGGKLRYSALFSRDTGAESSFLTLVDVNGIPTSVVTDNSRLSNSAQFSANYEATAKVQLNAALLLSRRSLVDTLTLSNGGQPNPTTGTDTLSGVNFGVTYAPLRSLFLACSVGHERRNSASVLSTSYSTDTASCSARFTLQ
jgi:hypothetical protein